MSIYVDAVRYHATTHDTVKQHWLFLQEKSQCRPFLTWAWQASWLIEIDSPLCVQFFYNNEIVGMCFLGEQSIQHIGLGYQVRSLNQSGVPEIDQAWIEYNDILALPEHITQCRHALMQWCFVSHKIDCFDINTSLTQPEQWAAESLEYLDGIVIEQEEILGYRTQLTNDSVSSKSRLDQILSILSANKRSQINRSIRYITEQYGDIDIRVHKGGALNEAFADTGQYHIARWQESQYGSGFTNPKFVGFHQRLFHEASGQFDIQILEFTTDTIKLGYLYFFIKDGIAYFYLSGINYCDSDNKYRVGLVIHVLAMTYFAERGVHTYDFMGGECAYKASLSTEQYSFYHTRVIKNKAFHLLHRSFNKIARTFGRAKHGEHTWV
ncbi:MAG: GNAT family N-acetyltransferase [Alteromonadaceae bacterium]|nr:GNAT family N-acetyltransferase [Alteromonadaceae bacterium]